MKKFHLILFAFLVSTTFAKAQISNEVEPNNNILQITQNTFTAPDTIQGYMSGSNNADSVDFFQIILPYCTAWIFDILNPDGTPSNINITIFNLQNISTGEIHDTDFDFRSGTPDSLIINASGILYVRIDQTNTNNNIGTYQLVIRPDLDNGWECNNYFSEAAPIPIDTIISNKLLGYGFDGNPDVDIFQVNVPQCGVLNVTASNIGGSAPTTNRDIRLTIYQPDSVTSIGNTGNGCDEVTVGGSYLVDSGIVYIKITDNTGTGIGNCQSAYDLSDTPFNLELNFDTTDSCECNNTFSTACAIPINSTRQIKLFGLNSTIYPAEGDEDRDVFVTNAPRDGVLNITASGIGGGGTTNQDIRITVFQPDTLTTIGNTGNGCDAQLVSGSYLVNSGTVYIKITDNTGTGIGNCQTAYDLSSTPFALTLDFDTTDACEINDNFLTACPIAINSTRQIKLWGLNSTLYPTREEDRDYFEVNIPQCSDLIVTASGIGGGGTTTQDILITVYQPDTLTPLVSSTTTGLCNAVTQTATYNNIQPGIAYIMVEDKTGTGIGNCQTIYNLSNIPFSLTVTVNNCVGLNELENQLQFSIFPNPASHILKLEFFDLNNLKSSIKIMNIQGEEVYQASIVQSEYEINVNHLSNGIYFIQISNDNGVTTKKFIKE